MSPNSCLSFPAAACYHAQHVRGGRGDGGAERVVCADDLLPGVEVVPGEEPRRGQPRQPGREPGHWARCGVS